ncbi:glucokinase [Nitrosomonas sp. Is37]|uniref:glucokinase n=1 Tax=Nitrosomonas sp. Is37 TaxID=3080535 RepID=UPI00294A9E2A|nr:glucokinase [Nitrosomonas sp. Is37]MDV6343807.1 glucokinase [Nitrosomonas sp. Is37]
MSSYFIYGDIGGTKTLLRTMVSDKDKTEPCYEWRYDSQAYADFNEILADFLDKTGMNKTNRYPTSACFGIAGPIVSQRAKLTNLPWLMDASALATEFSIPKVKLINDFEAVAIGIERLSRNDLATLQWGVADAQAMRVVLGAGTGMGVAWLHWQGDRYIPLPTEGGHIEFAPTTSLQMELLDYLMKKFDHVSVERILSGPGLTNIFNFLQNDSTRFPGIVVNELKEDSGAIITKLAFEQKHPIAQQALELFVEIYGAYAGNLALLGLCRGGVYIAGGIAPRIIDTLMKGSFMHAFCNKGRYTGMMSEIPVHVIMNPQVGLLGAGLEAQRLISNCT